MSHQTVCWLSGLGQISVAVAAPVDSPACLPAVHACLPAWCCSQVCTGSAQNELLAGFWAQQLLRPRQLLWFTVITSLLPVFREIEVRCDTLASRGKAWLCWVGSDMQLTSALQSYKWDQPCRGLLAHQPP